MIPVLMITYNRLEYTKQAFEALLNSGVGAANIYIIDNNSTDGTQEWLKGQPWARRVILNKENYGVAYAMNQFLEMTPGIEYAGKVDNDTLVTKNWHETLLAKCHSFGIDMIQAKHPIIKATNPKGWNGFTANMKREQRDASILYHHFIGGSGIVFKRWNILKVPETQWKLYGWRQYQREHPELIKAFCEDVEVKLLDEHGYTDYPEYYKETGRI